MRKADKAEYIIKGLSKNFYNESWLLYDDSIRGSIHFLVNGIKEPIQINTKTNCLEAIQIIANKVIENGFHYGNCELISSLEKHNKKPMIAPLETLVCQYEKDRIKNLGRNEKISEIKERYGIVLM